jgi:hypothetical protein
MATAQTFEVGTILTSFNISFVQLQFLEKYPFTGLLTKINHGKIFWSDKS